MGGESSSAASAARRLGAVKALEGGSGRTSPVRPRDEPTLRQVLVPGGPSASGETLGAGPRSPVPWHVLPRWPRGWGPARCVEHKRVLPGWLRSSANCWGVKQSAVRGWLGTLVTWSPFWKSDLICWLFLMGSRRWMVFSELFCASLSGEHGLQWCYCG